MTSEEQSKQLGRFRILYVGGPKNGVIEYWNDLKKEVRIPMGGPPDVNNVEDGGVPGFPTTKFATYKTAFQSVTDRTFVYTFNGKPEPLFEVINS